MARSVFPADTGNAREVAVGRDRRWVSASREFRILEAGRGAEKVRLFIPLNSFWKRTCRSCSDGISKILKKERPSAIWSDNFVKHRCSRSYRYNFFCRYRRVKFIKSIFSFEIRDRN